ncbi:MAG: phosphatase PAP2 family protein [Pseudomonadota bacterium]
MHFNILQYITDFGDSAVMAAITLAGIIYLISCKNYRAASVIFLSLLLASFGIGLLKLVFMSYLKNRFIRSPSGHVALSTAVLGIYTMIIAGQSPKKWQRIIGVSLVIALLIAIAASRVLLKYHNIYEVIIGFFVGYLAFICAGLFYLRNEEPAKINKGKLLLIIISIAFLVHGFRFPAENIIEKLAIELKHNTKICNHI